MARAIVACCLHNAIIINDTNCCTMSVEVIPIEP